MSTDTPTTTWPSFADMRSWPTEQLLGSLNGLSTGITEAEAHLAELHAQRRVVMAAAADADRGDDRVKVRDIAEACGVTDEAVTLQLRKARAELADE